MDGMCRVFGVSDPHHPKVIHEQRIGSQLNMVSQSWDGERVYFTSSLLANWDKTAPAGPDLQYFKAYSFDGETLTPAFSIDFIAEQLGSPHLMRFGAYSLYGMQPPKTKEVSAL